MFRYLGFLALITFLVSCNSKPSTDLLIGKWIYTQVEYANQTPVIIQKEEDLKEKAPAIIFFKNNNAQIESAQKIISKGTYFLEGDIIRYEEVLPEGIKRKIPFLINSLTNKELIFESMDRERIRIKAKRLEE